MLKPQLVGEWPPYLRHQEINGINSTIDGVRALDLSDCEHVIATYRAGFGAISIRKKRYTPTLRHWLHIFVFMTIYYERV